ncbi:MAG: preprotein translocase subunit SecY [Patescibacteria group bacterium]|nr:preprotein translocase subunit SecY [Patescibacteria group bacterium]
MDKILQKLNLIFSDKTLRNRILFILGALILFRILAAIPIPGVDSSRLQNFLSNNQFLGILNIFSGGGLSSLSIIMLGVGPYITSSIIMQLLTIMSPRLKAMYQEDGELGRKKFTQISRFLTVPLAFIQGITFMMLLQKQGIIVDVTLFDKFLNVLVITAGSVLLMWIGELMSEFGIGNGISIIIFAGIVASIPTQISQFLFTFDIAKLPVYLLFLGISILIVAGVVIINEAERPIPITYARQIRGRNASSGGTKTYLPLRVNQAGVMPIIFALSIMLFPQLIGNALAGASSGFLQAISGFFLWIVETTWLYAILYFVFVFLFTFFYTSVIFDPNKTSENLQKNGAFIPGIRPGSNTREYISKILNRVTLMGAVFLGLIAVIPIAMQSVTGSSTFAVGGTALLIVVSVVLDVIKKVEAQLSMREY